MKKIQSTLRKPVWIFALVFVLSLAVGAAMSIVPKATAAPATVPPAQQGIYAGPEKCATCHQDIYDTWSGTLHAQAFSSPVFQADWAQQGSLSSCLECHTTGFDALNDTYSEEGVTCESCHGPMQENHPKEPMPITPDYTLCARCHKTTTDEWRASKHAQVGINCEACHNPHSQAPRADSITALCSNCHKDTGSSFTHGTHANAGLQCSDCHMAVASNTNVTGGLVATGHTFTVGSDACVNCHKDTIHTRDTILKLTGETAGTAPTIDELQKQVQEQEQQIKNLEAQSSVRLYTGLIQGAIVGLVMGGVAAWIVSRRIRVVEVEDDQESK